MSHYEAVVHVNDSRVHPTKLELKLCPALATGMGWAHEDPVVIRLEGSSVRWQCTVGIKPPHWPYLWAEMNRIPDGSLSAGCQQVSDMLYDCGLSPTDHVPVSVAENGDLILDIARTTRG